MIGERQRGNDEASSPYPDNEEELREMNDEAESRCGTDDDDDGARANGIFPPGGPINVRGIARDSRKETSGSAAVKATKCEINCELFVFQRRRRWWVTRWK